LKFHRCCGDGTPKGLKADLQNLINPCKPQYLFIKHML
jgi:hypothetical protein